MSRALLQDLAIGFGIGVLVAVGPFTPGAWLPSIAAGAGVGTAFVAWRAWQRHRQPEAVETDAASVEALPDAEAAPPAPPTPWRVWVALAMLAAVFTPTARWLYASWTASIWTNAHGILIPPVMAWMIFAALRRDPEKGPEASPWGFAFLLPGLFLVAVDAILRTFQLGALGLVIALPGVSLLFLGTRRTRAIAIPLLLGIFMIPIPNSVATHLYLKMITAAAVEPVLTILGIPVLREGTVLILPNATFLVADACSGFATLYAAVGVAIVLAAYARSWPRRLLLVLSAWPLAVACNIVRVTLLVATANRYGLGLLDTPFHAASGVATFWVALLVLLLISDRNALREAAT